MTMRAPSSFFEKFTIISFCLILIELSFSIPVPIARPRHHNRQDYSKFYKPCHHDCQDPTKDIYKGFAWEKSGFHEGDIINPRVGQIVINDTRSTVVGDEFRWPEGKVYYQLDDTFTESQLHMIRESMSYIENNSCIKFIEKETEDFVLIISDPALGCSSSAGRQTGMQIMSLGPQCFQEVKSVVIHELMHAIGFVHEMSRKDRDKYIEIKFATNISQSYRNRLERSFSIQESDPLGFPYDYVSVMHYSGETTPDIQLLKKTEKGPIESHFGRKEFGMTGIDKLKLNKLYNCTTLPESEHHTNGHKTEPEHHNNGHKTESETAKSGVEKNFEMFSKSILSLVGA